MGIPGDDQETDIDGAFTFDFRRFLKEILTFARKNSCSYATVISTMFPDQPLLSAYASLFVVQGKDSVY